MTQMQNHNIKVDVCATGCGGIYFDWLELKKMDETSESDPEFLAKLAQTAVRKPSGDHRLNCPHCPEITMMRRFWSIDKTVEVDECAKCGGIWLDAGELTHIYSLYKTEADRVRAASEHLDKLFGAEFAKLKEYEDEQTIRKIGSALRFVAPSYYFRKLFG